MLLYFNVAKSSFKIGTTSTTYAQRHQLQHQQRQWIQLQHPQLQRQCQQLYSVNNGRNLQCWEEPLTVTAAKHGGVLPSKLYDNRTTKTPTVGTTAIRGVFANPSEWRQTYIDPLGPSVFPFYPAFLSLAPSARFRQHLS